MEAYFTNCEECGKPGVKAINILNVREKSTIEVKLCGECASWEDNLFLLGCQVCGAAEPSKTRPRVESPILLPQDKMMLLATGVCDQRRCITLACEAHHAFNRNFAKQIDAPKGLTSYDCSVCAKRIDKRKKCSVCKMGCYCSDECFAKDWRAHKAALH